jgi:hypothetical protein
MNPRDSKTSKGKRNMMHNIKKLSKDKTTPRKGIKNQTSSPVESPISIIGEFPCGQVDFFLDTRPL